MENNRLVIEFGKHKIVAEIINWKDEAPNEIVVYLCDQENRIIQDICLVRPHYDIDRNTCELKTDNDFVDCIVWGKSDNEDYIEKNVISVYEDEFE